MTRLFTAFILIVSLLGIFQPRALSCEDESALTLSSGEDSHSEEAEATAHDDEEEDNCGLELDCQDCLRCHRSLAIVIYSPLSLIDLSIPSAFGNLPSSTVRKSFTDTLLDPPRIS